MDHQQLEVSKSNLVISPSGISFNIGRIESDNIMMLSFLNQPSFSKDTKVHYERVLRAFFNLYSNCGIKEITVAHITLYLKNLMSGSSTKNFHLRVVSSFFGYLQKGGYIELNPAAAIGPEKVPDKFRFKIMDRDQVGRILDLETDPQKKVLLKILYYTGLRISEALSLKQDSFRVAENGGSYMTVIGKGTKVRTVFIPEEFFTEILAYVESNCSTCGYLFFDTSNQKPLTRYQAFRIIQAAAKRAKVDPLPSPHWFRHSSATHSIEAGAPIHVVQATLGHASINTTGKYLHATRTESNASYLLKKTDQIQD